MSITLYHVSFDLNEPLHKEFSPRIPSSVMSEEDDGIPRICFSDSIQGCIRAICGYPKIDSEYVDIIVWKHEFKSNEYLFDWNYLYLKNLVPDAAVTHEYWYTKEIILHGDIYRISNIKYRTFYIFQNKYKGSILNILSQYIEFDSDFENSDPCWIINEWVPNHLPLNKDSIIKRVEEELSHIEDEKEDNENSTLIYRKIFEKEPPVKKVIDYQYIDMIVSCQMHKII